jgi:hypothetical protein
MARRTWVDGTKVAWAAGMAIVPELAGTLAATGMTLGVPISIGRTKRG